MAASWDTRRVRAANAPTAFIESVIRPFLEGRTLADPDALRVQFMERPSMDDAEAKTYCAVEVALFDLCAKARGVPLSEMLGGRVRDAIRLYGSAGMYMPPERYAAEAAAIADLGFRAYKMRPGRRPRRRTWKPCARCAKPSAPTST